MLEFILLSIVLLLFETNNGSKLWIQENIGEVTDWFYNKKSNKAYLSTKEGVIAALDIQNKGDIIWRQVFDKDDIINQFEMSLDKNSLISLSNGNVLRKWKKLDGSLVWESTHFKKDNNKKNKKKNKNNIHNADMQILETNKIILIDNLDILSVYDQEEGTLIWKQIINDNNNNNNKTHQHKIYTDQISKTVYIITFYEQSVIVQSYSLTTGEFIQSATEYQHECSSLPSQFQVLSSPDSDTSLIVWYECSNDVTPLYAFLFSIESSTKLQITPLSVSFDQSKPSLNSWKFSKNAMSLSLSAEYCQIYDVKINSKSKQVSLISNKNTCPNINDSKLKYRGKIRRIWKSNNVNSATMGILTDDGSLCFIGNNGKIEWCREEALSSPLFVYLFDESVDESSLCSENMNEEQCEAAYNAPFPSFPQRLTNDIKSLLTMSGFDINELTKKLNTFFPISSAWLDDTFEKIITILSKTGKLFGLSSTTGDILWSINLKYLCTKDDDDDNGNYDIVTMLAIRQHPPHLLAVLTDKILNKSKIISISSPFHTSQTPHIHIDNVDYWIKNAFVTPWITRDHSDKITLLISGDNNAINVYPSNEDEKKAIKSNINSIFYHSYSSSEESLSGYNINNFQSSTIWRKSFIHSDEEIVDIIFSLHDQFIVNSVYRTGERGAIYKYLNPHLIGIATIERASKLLHIYLMDGITGRVYIHQYHNNVDYGSGGISLLLYENKFIYTFFNKHTLLTEITSIDLWQSNPINVPTKGRTPSEGYIVDENPLENNIFSSFSSPLPYITSQAYNFGLSIDKLLCVSNTRYSVSNKWILLKLSSGSIIQIDSKWLNTRRPLSAEVTQANKEEMLIPYKKNIPFNNLWTISQSLTLNRINNAISIGSPIESTSLFFAFGQLDLFYTTIKPSKNFDTIPADFDYPMLALILSGVVIAIIVAKHMAQSKKTKKEWK